MEKITYLDFDLLIERSGAGYILRVLESPAGEATAPFNPPFSQDEVEAFFVQIGQSRLIETPQMEILHAFGRRLFEATFNGEVRDRLRGSLSEAGRHRAGLRIRLRLADAPELSNLPWEFMYDPSLNRFLVLSVETPVVRYLEVSQTIQPLAVRPPLRILAMISSPKNFPRLDIEREWKNLQEALGDLVGRGLVSITRLDRPMLSELQQHLRREEYHIFHFIGHGTFSKSQQDGVLLLENEIGEGHRVSGRDLGTILHDHRPLRLVVLNACEGARTSLEDQFSGTAQSLMQQGLPAVIAMQFRITDIAAITLACEFYGALADGYPVDAALTEARKAIKTQGNELEWGTPVLYMRSPDGQIFDVTHTGLPAVASQKTTREETQTQLRLEQRYTEALEAYYIGKWELAHQRLQAVVNINPNYKDAAAKLETAKRKMRLHSWNDQATPAESAGDWGKAIQALEALVAEDPGFENAASRLAKAKSQKQLADLYAEAQELTQAKKWQPVVNIFNEIARIDPKYPDPQNLRTQAERLLVKARHEVELELGYKDAIRAIEADNWTEAVRLLRRVRGLQTGYRETKQLLKRAESEMKRARKDEGKQKTESSTRLGTEFEWLILELFAGFALARIVMELILGGTRFQALTDLTNLTITLAIFMGLLGTLIGLVLWWGITNIPIKLQRKQVALLIIGCAATIMIPLVIALQLSYHITAWPWTLMWSISGLSMGLILALILRKSKPAFSNRQFLLTCLSWGVAFTIGQQIGRQLKDGLLLINQNEYISNMLSMAAEEGIAGLIGGWVMLSQLKIGQNYRLNWKTILAGTLGFALGNLLITIIPFSLEEETAFYFLRYFIWGLIGSAALAFPSKRIRQYLITGLTGGVGLTLGYLVWILFKDPNYLYGIFLGSILGLSLGFITKRPSGVLILIISGAVAFTSPTIIINLSKSFTPNNNVANNSLYALTAAVFGFLIALAWSYLYSRSSNRV